MANEATQGPLPPQDDMNYMSCGNCGFHIGNKQQYTAILNIKYDKYEYYHESFRGCYESTQRNNARRRVILNRFRKGINELLYEDTNNNNSTDVSDSLTE